jgi:hypothetical protein
MPTYLVTVRERIDYTMRVEAPDHAGAGNEAMRLLIEHGFATAACADVQVADRQVIETEET